ncbi:MAG: hypothetical protein AAFN63_15980 [Pseudomonadota bacterium]
MTIKITSLKPSQASLGVILNFLSKSEPFASHSLKAIAGAVRVQLETANHLVALDGETIVGYAGWMRVTSENAESWLKKEAQLVQAHVSDADAAALTMVVSGEKSVTRMLIRSARDRNKGVRVVFRRDYETSGKQTKRQSVLNRA